MTPPNPAALHHTAFVVRDLEKTAKALKTSLGIGPWNIWTLEPTELKVRDVASRQSFKIGLATIGGGTYELISPVTGSGLYDEQLATKGEGFHHTCLAYQAVEDLRAVKSALVAEGREVIQEGGMGDVFEFVYIMFPELGSAVELLYLDADKLPPPDAVI
jgi:hypothetical protein